MMVDYYKIGQASDLSGRDKRIYRALEIFPGFLSWATLLALISLSYFKPIFVAYFLIAFDVYWLLLVLYLGIHLISAYKKFNKNVKIDWLKKVQDLDASEQADFPASLHEQGMKSSDLVHLLIIPISYEGLDILRPTFDAIVNDGFPSKQMIVVYGAEGRAGEEGLERARIIEKEYAHHFRNFLITVHPDGIEGEMKAKGANQAWSAKIVKKEIIDKEGIDYKKILVSVFDSDTIVSPGYFSCLSYKFLTVKEPYRVSYQPVPLYHNNVWRTSFFSRVAANSNTFWQMMQQIRNEKLATYSSHSMTWQALIDIGFWSTNMVSEDSRIFWHCYLFYNGEYRVEPMHFPVSMDATESESSWLTAKNLYKQQRRWGWGVENIPYIVFNVMRKWSKIKKKDAVSKIAVQFYGFHSWATNALIIGVIGWLPMILGGDRFNSTVLSTNLPQVTRTLMLFAMMGMVLSAIISTLLLPKRPKKYGFGKNLAMVLQWIILPFSIIVFGAVPGLEAQTRLMLNKRLGFQVTPKGKLTKNKNNSETWDQD